MYGHHPYAGQVSLLFCATLQMGLAHHLPRSTLEFSMLLMGWFLNEDSRRAPQKRAIPTRTSHVLAQIYMSLCVFISISHTTTFDNHVFCEKAHAQRVELAAAANATARAANDDDHKASRAAEKNGVVPIGAVPIGAAPIGVLADAKRAAARAEVEESHMCVRRPTTIYMSVFDAIGRQMVNLLSNKKTSIELDMSDVLGCLTADFFARQMKHLTTSLGWQLAPSPTPASWLELFLILFVESHKRQHGFPNLLDEDVDIANTSVDFVYLLSLANVNDISMFTQRNSVLAGEIEQFRSLCLSKRSTDQKTAPIAAFGFSVWSICYCFLLGDLVMVRYNSSGEWSPRCVAISILTTVLLRYNASPIPRSRTTLTPGTPGLVHRRLTTSKNRSRPYWGLMNSFCSILLVLIRARSRCSLAPFVT